MIKCDVTAAKRPTFFLTHPVYIYMYIYKDKDKFRAKSTWQPPKEDPVLETYLSLLEKEVMSVSPEGKNFSNLSSSEQNSLNRLNVIGT